MTKGLVGFSVGFWIVRRYVISSHSQQKPKFRNSQATDLTKVKVRNSTNRVSPRSLSKDCNRDPSSTAPKSLGFVTSVSTLTLERLESKMQKA